MHAMQNNAKVNSTNNHSTNLKNIKQTDAKQYSAHRKVNSHQNEYRVKERKSNSYSHSHSHSQNHRNRATIHRNGDGFEVGKQKLTRLQLNGNDRDGDRELNEHQLSGAYYAP